MELPSSLRLGLERVVRHACERCGVPAGLLFYARAGYLFPVVSVGLEGLSLSPLPASAEAVFPDLPAALQGAFPHWQPLPLSWQGRRVGWLLLGSREEISSRTRTRSEEAFFLDLLALLLLGWGEAAGREERLRILAEQTRLAEKRVALLRAIDEVNRQVLSLFNPTALLQNAAEALVRHLGYDYAHVLLLEDDTLVLRASAGRSGRAVLGRRFPLGRGITGWVAATQEPYLCNDVLNDPHYLYIDELGDVRSELTVPMRGATALSGVLDIQSNSPDAFDEADLLALTSLADHLGIALENAELYARLHDCMADLEQTRARLSQAERLSALGEVITGLVREISDPLTAIIGYAQLLQDTVQDAHVRQDLEKIIQEGQRAARIAETLLAFVQQRDPRFTATDLNDLLQQVLRRFRPELGPIEVKMELFPNLPPARADPGQLEQVLEHLLWNAGQSLGGAPGGLTLRTFYREDAGVPGGGWIGLEVGDSGPGTAPEILPHIFDPFFATRREAGGSGLGLAICYGIIGRHGGRIWAESEPGRGARFFVELPAWAPEKG
ncbi:MAG: ATP-binding protein [Chloroflexia bacterium]